MFLLSWPRPVLSQSGIAPAGGVPAVGANLLELANHHEEGASQLGVRLVCVRYCAPLES